MNLANQSVTQGIRAEFTPVAPSETNGTVGSTDTVLYPLSDAVYAIKAISGGSSSEAEFNISTGVCAASSGSVTVLRSGVNVQGIELDALDTVSGIRLTAPSTNSAYVEITAGGTGYPSLDMKPGARMTLSFDPAQPIEVPAGVMTIGFGHTGDSLVVEVLGHFLAAP